MLNEYNWYFVSVWNYVILLIFGSELIRVYNYNLLKFIAYYIYIYIYIYINGYYLFIEILIFLLIIKRTFVSFQKLCVDNWHDILKQSCNI